MTLAVRKLPRLLVACLGLAILTSSNVSSTQVVLPKPVLVFTGAEYYETGGRSFVRYRYTVDNLSAYPQDLFIPAPSLPPCGANTRAARTWVDVYEQSGRRLNGFCALGSPDDLSKLWFALETDVVPPSWVYIEMTDRQTGTKYKSNLAESTL
jgi:hypothetical protein